MPTKVDTYVKFCYYKSYVKMEGSTLMSAKWRKLYSNCIHVHINSVILSNINNKDQQIFYSVFIFPSLCIINLNQQPTV